MTNVGLDLFCYLACFSQVCKKDAQNILLQSKEAPLLVIDSRSWRWRLHALRVDRRLLSLFRDTQSSP